MNDERTTRSLTLTTGGITLLSVVLSIGVVVGVGLSAEWWVRLLAGLATTLALGAVVQLGTSAGRGPLARMANWVIGSDERGRASDGDAASVEESDVEEQLERALERTDPFMAWLGVLFALLVGYELAVDLGQSASRVLSIAGWVIWALFLTEFMAYLYLAPDRLRYVRRHWIRALAILIPALRFLRFVRLLRLGRALPAARVVTSSYRVAGTARKLLSTRLAYLGALATVVAVAVAELAFLFERDAAQPAFSSFGDAMLWALTVVVALQGDPTPTTTGARLVMLAGFAFGLVVVASLAGSIGAFLVDDRRERADAEERTGT